MTVPSFPSQGVETDAPGRDIRLGAIIFVAFFVVFLGWAAFARLDAGAYATGEVSVSGNRQAVQHREGGVVSALSIAEGDHVVRDEVLIELASGELIATERGLAGQVYALLAQRARMTAERDRLGAILTPPELTSLPPEDQALADEAMRLQRLQFAARRVGRGTETGVLSQRSQQLEQQIAGLERQIASNLEQRRLIVEELDGVRSLAAQGYAPLTRVRALERTAAALEGDEGSLRAQVARAREAIGETRLEMSGVTTKLNEDVAEQLKQVEVQLNELRPRLAEARAQIARNQVRAPATGQVVGLSVFTVGGVIQPGQTLMEIVPDDASQVIVASVSPADIDNLRPGLSTEIKFPGLRDRNPPIIHGRVTRISADRLTSENASGTHPYYRVEIVVPAEEMIRLGPSGDDIRPGMPVEVVVVTRKRTALQYLFEPLTRSLFRSGSER
ncbi:HlyD family type I secretion periplasmic adaptor subunit [Brevundimonas bullata]